LFFGLVTGLQADLVVVEKMSGDMQNGTVTLKFKGNRVRTDLTGQVSSISDAATGETWTLLHGKRAYVHGKLDPEHLKKNLPSADQPDAGSGKPIASGQRESVGEYECEIYTVARGNISAKYWVALNHPMAGVVRAALEPVSAVRPLVGGGLGLPVPTDFPGLILKTELLFEKVKAVLEFVSAKEEALPDRLFEVPKEYKETKPNAVP
jgi:hypothetical protein